MELVLTYLFAAYVDLIKITFVILNYYESYISPILLGPIAKVVSMVSLLIGLYFFLCTENIPQNKAIGTVFLSIFLGFSSHSIMHLLFFK